MRINLQNIEDLIFMDTKIHPLLPDFRPQFDQWKLAKRVSGLQTLSKQSLLNVLNGLGESHLGILKEYFGDEIILEKIDHHIVKEYNASCDEIVDGLCRFADFNNFCVSRNGKSINITYWR